MTYDNQRKYRLFDFDYARDGAYFVTICTRQRIPFFGTIADGVMNLSELGSIARNFWIEIPMRFVNARLDEFVFMPEHMHGIIILHNATETPRSESTGRHLIDQMRLLNNSGVGKRLISDEPQVGRHTPRRVPTCLRPLAKGSISSIINHFKGNVKRYCNQNGMGYFAWQRRFYDHVIRNEEELNQIRQYIHSNPARWQNVINYPENLFFS